MYFFSPPCECFGSPGEAAWQDTATGTERTVVLLLKPLAPCGRVLNVAK